MSECNGKLLETARSYLARGWRSVPIPYRSKKITIFGWEKWRLGKDDLPKHFNGNPQNIGVLLGEPSQWLIDVDLDHPRAVELADEFLPPTPLEFGRPGKPRSHRLYMVTRPAATRKFRSKSAGMIVEFRSTGAQTVFPPSTHEEGEPIEWVDESAQPAVVDPDVLLEACKSLADRVKIELGEKASPRPPKSKAVPAPQDAPPELPEINRAERCLKAMRRVGLTDKTDGSFRLYTLACRCVEHDLADDEGLAAIRTVAQERPFPRAFTDEEILKRLRDAEEKCTRGAALGVDDEGFVKLGNRDPDSGKLVLSPRKTLPTAEAYMRDFHTHMDGLTLRNYAEIMMEWRDNRYIEVEDAALKHRLQPWLHESLRYVYDKRTDSTILADFESNPGTVGAALETIRSHVHLPASATPPVWLSGGDNRPNPTEILPCRTMNIHIPTRQAIPSTPSLFTTNALPFDYDPHAAQPERWLSFLDDLWGDDVESIELLQECFGYYLTADTAQQKMLLLVGPRRSGKGTIGRVLTQLIGPSNVVGPTTGSLAGAFGLQPLIGKTLAIVSDARFSGENIAVVVERLLCISGEDALTVDRKHIGSVTMKLPTRFMFLTNELPRMCDSSKALAGRFLVLRLTQDHYGREKTNLTQELLAELPGILLWALEGWQRLHDRGHFVQPKSSEDAIRDLEDLSSPVGAFVRDRCTVAEEASVEASELFRAWKEYCESIGRDHVGTTQSFGRDLRAVVPELATRNLRDGDERTRWYEGITLRGTRRSDHVPF